jgi:hypothetical protein
MQEIVEVARPLLPSTYTEIIGRDGSLYNSHLMAHAQKWGTPGSRTHIDCSSALNRFRRYVTMPVASDDAIARFVTVLQDSAHEPPAPRSEAGPSGLPPPQPAVAAAADDDDDDDEPALKRARAMLSQDQILAGHSRDVEALAQV